jgi:pilus assembly protein CpaD
MTFTSFRTLMVLGMSALAGACASTAPGAVEDPRLPTQQFEAKVISAPHELRLALHAQGVSVRQGDALSQFVADWQSEEGGMIGIQAPSTGVDPSAAYRMGESTRSFLISKGVSADQIEVVGYDPGAEQGAPLLVSYVRYKAEIPKCGVEWTNLAHTFSNRASPNYGCAVTANMAAQIADPGDLLQPRTTTPQDASRRQEVLDKYRKGDITAATKDENASGAVSSAVK